MEIFGTNKLSDHIYILMHMMNIKSLTVYFRNLPVAVNAYKG